MSLRLLPAPPKMATHIFTSIAANYIPKARVLARSLKTLHPDFIFHVVLCDIIPAWLDLNEEPFDSILTIHDLDITDPEQWMFKHTIVELSTAVKGFALRRLLNLPNSERVLYFDPDMVILQPLTGLLKEFGASSILLTPHIAEPEQTIDAILDNEFSVLQHGIYNLGFVGVKASTEGQRFAAWWQDRLYHFCYDDIPRGLFTDQRWADLAPAYFPDCKILRDPVYNVCTWNLTHRTVTGSLQEGFLANGHPIVFYHFSGFDSGAQEAMLNKYGQNMPALYELRDWYVAECDRLGQGELSLIPWAYGYYENGERIPNGHRKLYRDRTDLQQAFPNPFLTSDISHSYLHWLAASGEEPAPDRRDIANDEVIPEYRIAVLAMAEDITFLADTLTSIRDSSARANDVTVFVGSDDNSVIVAGAQVLPIFVSCSTYHELFAAAVEMFKNKDILLIRAGLGTPEKWDLRLAWTAVRQGSVGTVSPLSSKALGPIDFNKAPVSATDLDSLCATSRLAGEKETSQFWPDCVYIRAEALREITNLSTKRTPTHLLDAFARARFSNILATHVCIGCERRDAADIPMDIGIAPLIEGMRSNILARLLLESTQQSITKRMTKATLHIMHSWGGGLERWVHDYCANDHQHDHYILKSFGPWSAFGSELRLFNAVDTTTPLATWTLTPPIKATSGADSRYAGILGEIRQKYGVGRIIISSFIGHSIESMRQHVPTIVVCHDYYPFCPALYITFGSLCKSCDKECLTICGEENPLNSLFRNVPPVFWTQLRKEFIGAAQSAQVAMVAPSFSVERHYRDLAPALADRITVIEGMGRRRSPP